MKLNIAERFVVSEVLPKEGDFLTLKAIRKTREALSPTEKEQKMWDMKSVVDNAGRNNITWKQDVDTTTKIEISELGCEIIKNALKKLDSEKKLTERYYTIYEKFVNGDE